jgi:hypothetical protein
MRRIGVAIVSTIVEPEAAALDTVNGEPFARMLNEPPAATVAAMASL